MSKQKFLTILFLTTILLFSGVSQDPDDDGDDIDYPEEFEQEDDQEDDDQDDDDEDDEDLLPEGLSEDDDDDNGQVGEEGQFVEAQQDQDDSERALGGSKKGCVSRDTIMQRGLRWVKLKVGYNQKQNFQGYRKDCSGFVSMCWGLPKNGPTTSGIPAYAVRIKKDQLQRGDALNCASTHVVLFDSWADSGKKYYWALEDANKKKGTIRRKNPYPFWTDKGCYVPLRYKNVC